MRPVKLLVSLALFLALAIPATATINLVTGQHFINRNATCNTSGGCSFSFAGNITANNLVIVCASNQSSTATLTIAMTGETWTTGASWPQSPGTGANAGQIYCWFVAKAVGGNLAVVLTPSAGTPTVAIAAAEFHSTLSGTFTDDTATFHDASCTSSCSATLTTSAITPTSSTGDVIFSFLWYGGGTAGTTCTANNSFTVGDCNPAAYNRGTSVYLLATDTSAHTPSLTLGAGTPTNSAAVAIAIKEPTGGGGATIFKHKHGII